MQAVLEARASTTGTYMPAMLYDSRRSMPVMTHLRTARDIAVVTGAMLALLALISGVIYGMLTFWAMVMSV